MKATILYKCYINHKSDYPVPIKIALEFEINLIKALTVSFLDYDLFWTVETILFFCLVQRRMQLFREERLLTQDLGLFFNRICS